VVFVFHAMKSASGLQVAKLGIDYLGTKELAFGGHNENENSFNQGSFRELAKLLSGIMINLNNF
jgi:hypothetical protein